MCLYSLVDKAPYQFYSTQLLIFYVRRLQQGLKLVCIWHPVQIQAVMMYNLYSVIFMLLSINRRLLQGSFEYCFCVVLLMLRIQGYPD